MPNLLRTSILGLSTLLLSIAPFSAQAQSCNRYYGGSAYPAPAYPTYATPYSGYYNYNVPAYAAPSYGYSYSTPYANRYRYDDHAWREQREHERREHEWRERGRWYR